MMETTDKQDLLCYFSCILLALRRQMIVKLINTLFTKKNINVWWYGKFSGCNMCKKCCFAHSEEK